MKSGILFRSTACAQITELQRKIQSAIVCLHVCVREREMGQGDGGGVVWHIWLKNCSICRGRHVVLYYLGTRHCTT